MARMRAVKQQLKDLLSAPDWRDHLSELRSMGQPAVGPLFSFLLLEPLMRHKAALALGQVVAGLEEGSAEDMHNIMRRLMWHMNEESGNIGWGIPEAFGEVLAACPRAAKEFHRVLISYVIDLGRDVSVETVVKEAIAQKVDVIAGSALMTTTMPAQKDIIRILEEEGVRDQFKCVFGGAPVSEDWVKKIGADGYSENACDAIEMIKSLIA